MLFKFRACERVLWFCPHGTVITTESTSSKQSGSRFCELMRRCLTWGRWTAQPRHFHRTAPSLHSGSNSHQSILHLLHEPPYTSPSRDRGVGHGYTVCLEGLGPVVRELWSRNCQMTIDRFVSFLGQVTNPEELQLRDNRIPAVEKIRIAGSCLIHRRERCRSGELVRSGSISHIPFTSSQCWWPLEGC